MKKLMSIFLALMLVLALAACGGNEGGEPTASSPEAPSASLPASPEPSDVAEQAVRVGFLKGPTGMGAAQLMERAASGGLDAKYEITLEADPSVVTGALVSGELDIAAVPTNTAAALYAKTGGKLRIAAINTLGVLYILEKGDSVQSVGDLAGRTIYATGQGSNPEYVLNYILRENGLEPGESVTVEYLASDELATRMAVGELDICMLPVPAATSVLLKNKDVREALDLTEEWDAASGDGGVLSQGCIVVGESVSDETVSEFLTAYGESIAFMTDERNLDAAAKLAVSHEIVAAEPVAKAAIPKCGMTFITGADAIREQLTGYYRMLYSADPTSIGGSIPDDAFYWES